MEYKEDNGVAGRVPKFGAIFMSNIATKRECFRRKLFGLPSAQANFVKQVRAGMVLFLFEFERRELLGVFRACSDGAMNIVPHAFSSSGKQFPAQVRFTPIWYCRPLSENEFRDPIRDNYFSAKKFHFGLSEDQVCRLLWLFDSKKLKNKLPQRQFAREVTRPVEKDRRQDDGHKIGVADMIAFEPDVGNDLWPDILSEYTAKSLDSVKRVDSDGFLMGDMVENDHKVEYGLRQGICTGYPGDAWVKKERKDHDCRLLTSDVTENECLDRGPVQAIWNEYFEDSLGEVRRVANDGWFLTGNKVNDECEMENNLGPASSSEYPGNSFNEVASNGRFVMMERVENECIMDNGFGPVVSTEHHQKPLGKVRLATDDGSFLISNSCVENERNMDNGLGPVIAAEDLGNLLGKRVTDDRWFLRENRLQNKRNVDNGIGSVILTEHLGNSPGRVRRATDDGRFLLSERVETERNFSTEQFGNVLGKVRRTTDAVMFPISDRVEKEHNAGNSFGPIFPSEYSRDNLVEDRQAVDDIRFRKSDGVENGCDMVISLGSDISTGYTVLCQSMQNPSVYSSKPLLGSDYSSLPDQLSHSSAFLRSKEHQIFDRSYPTSHDSIVTRTVPYDPEVPEICYRPSSPFVANHISSSYQHFPSYQGSEGNLISSSKCKLSPYYLQAEGSRRCLDVASGYGNEVPFPNASNYHDRSFCGTSNTSSNAGYYENRDVKTTTYEGYKSSVFADPSLENPSFAFDSGYPVGSQSKYVYKYPWCESNEEITAKEFHSSYDSHLQYGASSSEARGLHDRVKDSVTNENEYYQSSKSNTKTNRTSVFARLTSAPEVCIEEVNENDTCMVYDEYDVDASVDEVMDILHHVQCHGEKMRKYKPLVRQHDEDEGIRTSHNQMEYEQSTMKREIEANRTIEASGGSILEETRPVDFKRRSQIKKNLFETCTKASVGISEGKTSVENAEAEGLVVKASVENAEGGGLVGKLRKRRKLVRPVFGKKESFDEGIGCDSSPDLHLPSQREYNVESCHDAVKSCEDNVGLTPSMLSNSFEGSNTNTGKSSECKGNGNAGNSRASFRCREGKDGRQLSQGNDILNATSQVPSKSTNENIKWGSGIEVSVVDVLSQDLGMIGCSSSNAQKSPPGVHEVTADCANCTGNEVLFPDLAMRKEICPQL